MIRLLVVAVLFAYQGLAPAMGEPDRPTGGDIAIDSAACDPAADDADDAADQASIERCAQGNAVGVLRLFMRRLAAGEDRAAYRLVAPSSKKHGDPIADRALLDWESFRRELSPRESRDKFAEYKILGQNDDSKQRTRITIIQDGWDTDETLILREKGKWYVADPIHIIR